MRDVILVLIYLSYYFKRKHGIIFFSNLLLINRERIAITEIGYTCPVLSIALAFDTVK